MQQEKKNWCKTKTIEQW